MTEREATELDQNKVRANCSDWLSAEEITERSWAIDNKSESRSKQKAHTSQLSSFSMPLALAFACAIRCSHSRTARTVTLL